MRPLKNVGILDDGIMDFREMGKWFIVITSLDRKVNKDEWNCAWRLRYEKHL